MLEEILPYERYLFFLINSSHTAFLDNIMWLFSGPLMWIPLMLFFLVSLIYNKKWQEWLPVLIAIAFLFVCCDQFSSHICKPFFARLRPTHHPDFMNEVRTLYGYVGGKYGFISGHATNAFGFATLTTLLFKNRVYACIIYIWAVTVSYSRVYLGVHFISDVVAGAISGIAIGVIVYQLYTLYIRKVAKDQIIPIYSKRRAKIITDTIITYIFLFALFSDKMVILTNNISK